MSLYETKLIVVSGANAGQELLLGERPILIGRDSDCDLALNDSYASRHHCWIEQREGTWWVRDLGSKNKTWVGQEPVAHERQLYDGDLILVGHSQLRLQAPEATKTYETIPALTPTRVLHLNHNARQVIINDSLIDPPLSPKQWALLVLLHNHRQEVVTKDQIVQAVWPEAEGAIYDYQVDKLVSRLRARLGIAGDDLIETHWGVGYRLL